MSKSRALLIVRGLPGSGKSTLARQLLTTHDDTARHYEADQYFVDEQGNYNWDPAKLGAAHMWCQAQVWKALEEERTVIVSNTFTTRKELHPYFDMIHQFEQNPTVFLAQSNFGSLHSVPDIVLENMRKRFLFDITDMFKVF